MRDQRIHKIVLCAHCEGRGFNWHEELTNYHKREYDVTRVTCVACNGSGRLNERTEVLYTPYDPEQK